MNYYVDGDERVKEKKYSIKVLSEKKEHRNRIRGEKTAEKEEKEMIKLK